MSDDIQKIQDRTLLAFMSAGAIQLESKEYAANILMIMNTTGVAPDSPVKGAGQVAFAVPYSKNDSSFINSLVDNEELHTEMNGTKTHRLMPSDIVDMLKQHGIGKGDAFSTVTPSKGATPAEAVLVVSDDARRKLSIAALRTLADAQRAPESLQLRPSEYRAGLGNKSSELSKMIGVIVRSGGFKQGDRDLESLVADITNGESKNTDMALAIHEASKTLPRAKAEPISNKPISPKRRDDGAVPPLSR